MSTRADAIWSEAPRHGRSARLRRTILLAMIVAAAWALAAGLFVADVTQYVVVTRFGRVVRVIDSPGLYLTLPVDRVQRLDRRLAFSTPARAEYLTADKKNVVVQSLIAWRITDPVRFLATLASRARADQRLADVALGEIGAVLGRHPFSALVSAGPMAQPERSLVSEIRDGVAAAARPAFGVEVSEISLRGIALPEQNRQSVFERMKAERGRIAVRYRSEGELEAKKLIAAADRQKVEIDAQAYAQAQRLRAEGDADASGIYAKAAGRDPIFYRFLRTLQADEKILGGGATLVLPAEAEALGVLQEAGRTGLIPEHRLQPAPGAPRPNPTAPDAVAEAPGGPALDLLLGRLHGQEGRP